jgi:transitional endoplasmic reticulum ATPase
MSRPGENYKPYSLAGWVFWRIGQTTGSFFRGLQESAQWGWQAAREDFSNFSRQPFRRTSGDTKHPILTVLLVVVPIAAVAAFGPPKWFINWLVMLAASIVLAQILRGPLAEAPSFLRKCVKLAISFCLLIAFTKLLYWKPLWAMLAPPVAESSQARAWIMVISVLGWWVAVFWIIFSRPKDRRAVAGVVQSRGVSDTSNAGACSVSTVPRVRFSEVGGLEQAKEQIGQLVRGQLEPAKYKPYGVVRNGILLHGPRGSGKTFLAKATAGEFGLNFWYVSSPELLEKWIGTTGGNIRSEFSAAAEHKPVLFFIDEVDCLGAGRQARGSRGDPGGAGREFNNVVVQLMQSIDYYRELPGFVLMAATNVLDGLDEALIRPGRFDLQLRIDLPDGTTRLKIFETQLSQRPWHRFDLQEFARKTPGASPAKIRALVDQAAAFAADEGRNIEEHDLLRALKAGGGKDRPLVEPVEWQDIVLEEHVEQDLRMLIQLLNGSERAERLGVGVPAGLLLLGPPGTGKTMIARLIATESRRSFYAITAADVLGGITGESVKRVSEVFARAREHSPSIIFLDEMDGLLPRNNRYVTHHDLQVVEQFMIEISNLQPEHNVFLVGTTNHVENIDPRVLRGGRFSEKISIGLPGPDGLQRLLGKYLGDVRLEPGLSLDGIAEQLGGLAPADLEAISQAAKRFAFNRAGQGDQLPALNLNDFKIAAERVRGAA